MLNSFSVLGIEQTTDKSIIQKVYENKVDVINIITAPEIEMQ